MEENIKSSFSSVNFSEAAKYCPQEKKTLENCSKAISYIVSNPILCKDIIENKELPGALLAVETGINRRTIEEHSKYIMAMIILRSGGFEPSLPSGGYLVTDTFPDYSILFQEDGRFIKALNKGYSAGDIIFDITPVKTKNRLTGYKKEALECAVFIVSFCILFLASWYFLFTPAGTVRISMNPDVMLSFNKAGLVTKAVGLNEDGERILEGFDRGFKNFKRATVDILRRARDFGYIEEGDSVSALAESEDAEWEIKTENTIKEIVLSRKLKFTEYSE